MNKFLFVALLALTATAFVKADEEGGEDIEYWGWGGWGGSSSGSTGSSSGSSSSTGQCAGVIKQHEGFVGQVYKDTMGYSTVCWGHLDRGATVGQKFTTAQCNAYFKSDYATAYNGAKTLVTNWNSLNAARQCVLIDMTYNLGLGGIRSFHTFLGYVQDGEFSKAASDMMGTAWAGQVGRRASEDSQMLSSGSF
mmetsp:Transcript_110762/g.155454  ORF Transcript_110762/g.155454 Transcript_110762/m.155454 type:complete len:194 (-) Transcript_110762:58-639(-)